LIRRVAAGGVELAVPLALLAIWWLWSTGSESFYFPPLPDILNTFGETWVFERVGSDVAPSLARLGAGFAIAVVIGVGGGTLLGLSYTARRTVAPIVEFLRAIPPPLFIPAGIVVLGVGDRMRVFIIALACVWPILLNAIDGVAGVETTLVETARSYGIRPLDRLRSVILPAALPQIFAGMHTSLSLAIIMMVVSEMVASTNGIGFFILQSQRLFAIPEMWSGILLLGLLGYGLNYGFTLVERRVLRWHRGARAGALART
jgi:ABC-type nitrate/sulfonate/bicarbonate transport system permease component